MSSGADFKEGQDIEEELNKFNSTMRLPVRPIEILISQYSTKSLVCMKDFKPICPIFIAEIVGNLV